MESHTFFSSFLKHGVIMDNASVFESRLKKPHVYEQASHQTYQILAINIIPDFSQIITKDKFIFNRSVSNTPAKTVEKLTRQQKQLLRIQETGGVEMIR